MEIVRSINDIKTNRSLLNKINTSISTLRRYNLNLEVDDVENSYFLIEIKEKIPHIAYTKSEEEKDRLKEKREEITIEGFIKFYTNLIIIEERAQYVRKQIRSDDSSQQLRAQNRLNLHQANIKPHNQTYKYTDPGKNKQARENIKGNFNGRIQGNIKRNFNQSNTPPQEGISVPRYCIFCKTKTHDTGFCIIARYTAEYKT